MLDAAVVGVAAGEGVGLAVAAVGVARGRVVQLHQHAVRVQEEAHRVHLAPEHPVGVHAHNHLRGRANHLDCTSKRDDDNNNNNNNNNNNRRDVYALRFRLILVYC